MRGNPLMQLITSVIAYETTLSTDANTGNYWLQNPKNDMMCATGMGAARGGCPFCLPSR